MQNEDLENNGAIKRMIPYNTGMEKLALAEYGRLVHDMARAALGIEDRQLRTEFAFLVIDVMKSVLQ